MKLEKGYVKILRGVHLQTEKLVAVKNFGSTANRSSSAMIRITRL